MHTNNKDVYGVVWGISHMIIYRDKWMVSDYFLLKDAAHVYMRAVVGGS